MLRISFKLCRSGAQNLLSRCLLAENRSSEKNGSRSKSSSGRLWPSVLVFVAKFVMCSTPAFLAIFGNAVQASITEDNQTEFLSSVKPAIMHAREEAGNDVGAVATMAYLVPVALEFRWGLFVLGRADFSWEQRGSERVLEITGETKGPLSLFKKYRGRGRLRKSSELSVFSLKGNDSGVDEYREIWFRDGADPTVEQFSDKDQSLPLALQDNWVAKGLASPLLPITWMFEQVVSGRPCASDFYVYDAKRFYQIVLSDLPIERIADSADMRYTANRVGCKLTLLGRSLEQSQERSSRRSNDSPASRWRSIWPFSGGDSVVEFRFCNVATSSGQKLSLHSVWIKAGWASIKSGKRRCER